MDLEDIEAQYKATSTYIFVKDPSSPLVPVMHPVVFAQQYEDVVIPCKPSSKDVLVELVKDEQEVNCPTKSSTLKSTHFQISVCYNLQSIVYPFC